MKPEIISAKNVYRPRREDGQTFSLVLSDGTALSLPLQALEEAVLQRGLSPRCDFLDFDATLLYRRKNNIPLPRLLISACLAGERCRYDGGANLVPELRPLAQGGDALPVCPECAGGLPCPRTPCERREARILGRDGGDYTASFQSGVDWVLRALDLFPIEAAILKARSPSCGVDRIYDGTFSGRLIPGAGLLAQALSAKGVSLSTEETAPLP